MSRAGFLVGLALTLSAAPVAAQDATVPIGTRVRIETTGKEKFDGILLSRDADSIAVRRSVGARTVVPTASVARLRVSEGRYRSTGAARGAKRGALIGASALGVVGLIAAAEDSDSFGWMPFFLAVGVTYGGVIGALAGAVIGAERWTTVYGRSMRLSYRSLPHGRQAIGFRIQ